MAGGDENKGAHSEPGSQCDDVKQLKILFVELKDQHTKLSEVVAAQGKDLKEILEFQGGTKVYVAEIKEQLGRMEDRLFKFMGDLVTNLTAKETNLATTEAKKEEALEAARTKENMHKWDKLWDTLKAIIQIAAGVIAGIFVSKGGN